MDCTENETCSYQNNDNVNGRDQVDDWELLSVPPLVQHSNKSMIDCTLVRMGKDKKGDSLCGYLEKFGEKGIIKTWKRRWFVYDPRRCLLHYYHRPQDVEPLGNINISNASFRADDKSLFEVISDGRTYQLQAPDRNTMLFWLQELQTRRRLFGKQEARVGLIEESHKNKSSDVESKNLIDDNEGNNKLISAPLTVGRSSASIPENRNSWNFSFANLNTEFKNWRKGTFAPVIANGEPMPINHSNKAGFDEIVGTINKQSSLLSNGINNGNSTFYNVKTCPQCNENDSMISVLKEAISVAQIEIHTRDDVIKSLSEQLKFATDTRSPKSHDEELLAEREQYILQLTRMIKKFQSEADDMRSHLKEKDIKIEEFLEKEMVLKEMIDVKDNSIVDLTNRIDNLEKRVKNSSSVETSYNDELDLDKTQLKDTCNALKEQNDFLNNEILEITTISQSNAEKLKSSNVKLERQEAEFLKLKSRYLFLLNEFSTPRRGGSDEETVCPQIIERLIDDAIDEKGDVTDLSINLENMLVDKYGFFDSPDDETVKVVGEDIELFPEGDNEHMPLEVSVKVKWENYLVSLGTSIITRTEELKLLVRQGIPHQYRAQVWKDLLYARIESERNKVGPSYYTDLLKEKEGTYSPSMKQIELDLLRTLPNNKYYEKVSSEGTAKLRRVLLAYSWHNPAVGYCQGLNRLGAIILLYLDEETAFWGLVAMVEFLMPGDYFSTTLLGAQVDQRVLRELLEVKCPRLSVHLQSMHLDLSLISFNWFLTIFVDFLPIELMLRVWDTFFCEGSKVLFRYALAIFKLFEEDLMKFTDAGHVFDFFRKVPKSRFDTQKVIHIAFVQLNPFSMKSIESKRRYYRPVLQTQLDEFEAMRKSYRQKRETTASDLLSFSDDDC